MIDSARGGFSLSQIQLNDEQREAVTCDSGAQLVFAGAGTGKTRVLTAKIAFIISHKGIAPEQVFAATFTNKAAGEMKSRVEQLVGMPCRDLWIGTFHSLCARILRREAHVLGFNRNFTIYDRSDQQSVMKKVLEKLRIEERRISPRKAIRAVAAWKNTCTPPERATEAAGSFIDQELARVYDAYCRSLNDCNAMDFDDLIANVVYLFRRNPRVEGYYRKQFQYVLVDEYQDTNVAQFHLMKHLAADHGRVFAVGDDDQGIYAWRGASRDNIYNFEQSFAGTRVFTLERNYRSRQSILDVANALIASSNRRTNKRLRPCRDGRGEAVLVGYEGDRDEARGVCERIRELAAEGVREGDIGVLFRTNAQSRAFEEAFRREGIPYVLVGATSFYERKEIKDCLAYLRMLVNPRDDTAFSRILNVPPRGLGDKARQALAQRAHAEENSMLETVLNSPAECLGNRARSGVTQLKELFGGLMDAGREAEPHVMLELLLSESGYLESLESEGTVEAESRLDNVNELLNAMRAWERENRGRGLAAFLEEVSLATDVDRWERRDRAVNLMTLHCAKGLEFDTVFLAGLEDGIIPSRLNFDDEALMEEECRLLYVGMTRARNRLQCSHVERRWRFGKSMDMEPCRFLESIPESLLRFEDRTRTRPSFVPRVAHSSRREPDAEPAEASPAEVFSQDTVEFRMGQHVVHGTYGRGRVVNLSGFGSDLRLTVLFNDGRRRKLMARAAMLETV